MVSPVEVGKKSSNRLSSNTPAHFGDNPTGCFVSRRSQMTWDEKIEDGVGDNLSGPLARRCRRRTGPRQPTGGPTPGPAADAIGRDRPRQAVPDSSTARPDGLSKPRTRGVDILFIGQAGGNLESAGCAGVSRRRRVDFGPAIFTTRFSQLALARPGLTAVFRAGRCAPDRPECHVTYGRSGRGLPAKTPETPRREDRRRSGCHTHVVMGVVGVRTQRCGIGPTTPMTT